MKLLAEGARYVRRWPWPFARKRDPGYGQALAARLRARAIQLSCNKATEGSPEIEKLHLMAAKVALLSFPPSSTELAEYEAAVFYYEAFNHPMVRSYRRFKAKESSMSSPRR